MIENENLHDARSSNEYQNVETAEGPLNAVSDTIREYDYAFVNSTARIAVYDDLQSSPRVTEIGPAPTSDYISSIATTTYQQARDLGGHIPFTVIREVSENFIHARFTEVTISVLDGGDTIRFADQGPGISDADKAELPGFTSAVEPMKEYIRGVGSGLPLVKDYFDSNHGTVSIEDNVKSGAVITISLEGSAREAFAGKRSDAQAQRFPREGRVAEYASAPEPETSHPAAEKSSYTADDLKRAYEEGIAAAQAAQRNPSLNRSYPGEITYAWQRSSDWDSSQRPFSQERIEDSRYLRPPTPTRIPSPILNAREQHFLILLLSEGPLGVTDISRLADTPASSTFNSLKRLEESGLIKRLADSKRTLTDYGYQIANTL